MDARIERGKEAFKAPTSVNHAERRVAKSVEHRRARKSQAASAKRRRILDDGVDGDAATAELLSPAAVLAAVRELIVNDQVAGSRLAALKSIRRFSSITDEEGLQSILDAGALPALAFFLTIVPAGGGAVSDEERLEALWVCTNLAAGSHEQTMHVVHAASPQLVALLRSPSILLADHAAWALGNCAGDGQEARDVLLAQGVAGPLVALLAARARAAAGTAAWALSNMLKGQFSVARPYVHAGAIPAAMHWVASIYTVATVASSSAPRAAVAPDFAAKQLDLIAECCWVLAYLSDKEPLACSLLMSSGALPAVACVLQHGSVHSITPCLRICGNLLAHSNDAVSLALDDAECPGLLCTLARIASPPHLLPALPGGGGDSGGMDTEDAASSAAEAAAVAYDADHTASISDSLLAIGVAASADIATTFSPDTSAAAAADGGSSALPPTLQTLPADARFSLGHVREALWVLSNIAGGEPRHALALLAAPLPADVASSCAAALAGAGTPPPQLGYVTLLASHAAGTWQVRRSAAWALFNVANQRFPSCCTAVAAAAGGAEWSDDTSAMPAYPLLGAVLAFPGVLTLFSGLLAAPDLELAGLGLAFADLVMYNWHRPRRVPWPSPFAPPLPGAAATGGGGGEAAAKGAAAAAPTVSVLLPPTVRILGPHSTRGCHLLEGAGAIERLEALRDAGAAGDGTSDGDCESGDSALSCAGGGGACGGGAPRRRQVSAWAAHLLDTFFGEDCEEEEEDEEEEAGPGGDDGPGGSATASAPATAFAPAVEPGGAFIFGLPSNGSVFGAGFGAAAASSAAPLPGAGRGRGAVMPAWMTRGAAPTS